VFVPRKPFQISTTFVGKAGAYPSKTPFRCSTLRLAPGLAHKQYTRLERLVRSECSTLLRKFVTYDRKMFYKSGPWMNSTQPVPALTAGDQALSSVYTSDHISTILRLHDTQHNDVHYNDTQNIVFSIMILSVTTFSITILSITLK
jgi:hypothetical protein